MNMSRGSQMAHPPLRPSAAPRLICLLCYPGQGRPGLLWATPQGRASWCITCQTVERETSEGSKLSKLKPNSIGQDPLELTDASMH